MLAEEITSVKPAPIGGTGLAGVIAGLEPQTIQNLLRVVNQKLRIAHTEDFVICYSFWGFWLHA